MTVAVAARGLDKLGHFIRGQILARAIDGIRLAFITVRFAEIVACSKSLIFPLGCNV